jgi:hypothetical protein
MLWTAEFFPIRRLEPSDGPGLVIGKITPEPCAFCSEPRIDTCYNCERSICGNHGIPEVMLAYPTGQPLMVLNVCPECARDNKLEVHARG